MRPSVYFEHPANTFGTAIEAELVSAISEKFHDCRIVSPSDSAYAESYAEWCKSRGGGMGFDFEEVLPNCQIGVFLLHPGGHWSCRAASIAEHFQGRSLPVWEISSEGEIFPRGYLDGVPARSILSAASSRLRIFRPNGTLRSFSAPF